MDNVEFQFSLVIGSDIGKELCNFRNNKSCNTRIVEKILHYYKNYPIFTTSELMREYYYDFPTILNAVLSNVTIPHIDIDNSSEEDIAKNTIYKLVLCNDENKKDTFPYIYIGGDKIENNFTATFHKGEPRYKALEHLKALLNKAKCICIYDEYLLMPDKKINGNWAYRNWKFFKIFCHKLLPKTPLKIRYMEIKQKTNNKPPYNLQSIRYDINNVCTKWNWQNVTEEHLKRLNLNYSHQYAHDRYLIVDNKIEIIFTSGIRYSMSKKKDFTYIVRPHRPR